MNIVHNQKTVSLQESMKKRKKNLKKRRITIGNKIKNSNEYSHNKINKALLAICLLARFVIQNCFETIKKKLKVQQKFKLQSRFKFTNFEY